MENVRIGLFLLHRFIGMLLFVFFVTINVGNIVVSFSTLYRSPEVNFLLTTPVSYQNIFVIKFLDNFFYSSGTLFMVGFSVLLGYGVYFDMPWHFYLVSMFAVVVPFMFFAACAAVIILLLLMKFTSKINFRILVIGILLFYVLQIYLYFKVSSPIHLVQEVMKYYPYIDLYFGSLDPMAIKFLPNYWVSEVLYFYATKNYIAVAGYVGLLLSTTSALFIFALILGKSLFYETWMISLSLKSVVARNTEVKGTFFNFGKRSFLSPQTEVLLKKELWQFVREPSQWLHFVVMMGLLFLFLSSVSTLNIKLESPELRAVVYLVVFIFNIFLINSIALRFGFPLISLEGYAYWSIRSAPITARKMYWIKFGVIMIFLVGLSLMISWLSNIPYLSPSDAGKTIGIVESSASQGPVKILAYFSMVITPVVAITLTSMNFGLGAVYVNFIEKNPVRIASSQGATMTFLLSIVYLVFLLASYFYPVTMLFTSDAKNLAIDWKTLEIAFLMIVVPSITIILFVHYLGVRSLRRDY